MVALDGLLKKLEELITDQLQSTTAIKIELRELIGVFGSKNRRIG